MTPTTRAAVMIAAAIASALTTTVASATTFDRDGMITLHASQIGASSDGANLGMSWLAALAFPAPVTVAAGDTLQGSICFGTGRLRIRRTGCYLWRRRYMSDDDPSRSSGARAAPTRRRS